MSNVIPFKGRTFYKPMPDGNWTIDTEELGRIIADKTGFDYEAVMAVLTVEYELLEEAGIAGEGKY